MTMWKDAILSEGYVKKMKISYGVASTVVWIAFVGISILSYKIGYQPGYVIALILAAMGLMLDLRLSALKENAVLFKALTKQAKQTADRSN